MAFLADIRRQFNKFSSNARRETLTAIAESQQALPWAQAKILFDHLAGIEDVAFSYVHDGCYARAHIMCRRLQEFGIYPKKAWAFMQKNPWYKFDEDTPLRAVFPDGKKAHWRYHVAPCLPVEITEGKIRMLVFDPSMFDGPVRLGQWRKAMHAEKSRVEVVPFGIRTKIRNADYKPGRKTGRHTDSNAETVMAEYSSYGTRLWQPLASKLKRKFG